MTVNTLTGEIVEGLDDLAHHEAADLFPLMLESELDQLAEDIRRNGLIEPVWLYDDPERGRLLLDGRNRLAACVRAGVTASTQVYQGNDPIGFSISQNVTRRHLTVVQRAKIANAMLPLYEVEAARRTGGRPPKDSEKPAAILQQVLEPGKRGPSSAELAAKRVGISGRSVAEYKQVTEQAPDLLPKVDSGEMTLREACRIIRERKAEAADPSPLTSNTCEAVAAPGTYREQQSAKWDLIAKRASTGSTSRQIADEFGMSEGGLKDAAKQRGVDFPADRVVGKTRRLDSNRIIRESASALENIVNGLGLINPDDLDPEQIQQWIDSLISSRKALSKAITQIQKRKSIQ